MSTIRFSPFNGIFENQAAGTIIIGSPGGGKTYFTNTVIANALIMNQRVFAIDPKNDISVIQDYFNDMEVIDINNIEPGSLNPFVVLKDIDATTISSVISIICGGFSQEQDTEITPIIDDIVTTYKRSGTAMSMKQIAEYLNGQESKHLRAIASKLRAASSTKYGPLMFSDNVIGYDDEGSEILAEKYKFTQNSKVISLHGMNLPKADSTDLRDDQRYNSAIVYIICRMARELMLTDNYPTLFVIDEAHIAYGSKEFSDVINDLLVLGRSLNVATLLASQSVHHYPKGIEQLMSNAFMFKSAPSDSREFLARFASTEGKNKIDVDSVVDAADNFNAGEVFFIDRRNRSGIFKVTSPLANMTSNPLKKKKKEVV